MTSISKSADRGFSLVEVVVALGLCAAAIATAFLCLATLGQVAQTAEDETAAARACKALLVQLQSQPFEASVPELLSSSEYSRANLSTDGRFFYADRHGLKIGHANDSAWTSTGAERFFEIALVRNATLSPLESDPLALVIAFDLRVRWPLGLTGAMRPAHARTYTGSIRRS
jgi:hypothetical protein